MMLNTFSCAHPPCVCQVYYVKFINCVIQTLFILTNFFPLMYPNMYLCLWGANTFLMMALVSLETAQIPSLG